MVAVLAVDAGTTGVTALMVGGDCQVLARGYCEFEQHFPAAGWVEHEPEDIWQAVLTAVRQCLALTSEKPVALGVTNQRETAVLWDRASLAAPRRAIVWQDRRTAQICTELAPHEQTVRVRTGLRLDPYFTGTKLTWLSRHDPSWAGVLAGVTAVGTVDSYVVARATAGRHHVTDPSNASRTLLFDLDSGAWSPELGQLLDVPLAALPTVVPSSGVIGLTDPSAFCGLEIPVAGIAGDQQAALFGQACFTVGSSKSTYGTGAFVLVNTGNVPVRSPGGLLTTVAWDLGDGLVYALEGSVFVAGAAVQWLRDGLGLIATAAQVEALAASVPDTAGVVFVPALTGLGAPDWDPAARGTILGLTRGTTKAHLARAALEAVAMQVRDVVGLMGELTHLTVDGGASANDLLCQLQADQLGVRVRRPAVQETTALGVAFLAGLAVGVWPSTDELAAAWRLDREFLPTPGARSDGRHERWRRAVATAREFGS
jgi:glycerol kinase